MKQIAKNINYKVNTEYGAIDITINLSKPEKDLNKLLKKEYWKIQIIQNVYSV